MGVMPDCWIEDMARNHGMIRPFARNRARKDRISYGVSCYGYDFRLANEFKIPRFGTAMRFDPKKPDQTSWINHRSSFFWIPPNSYILGRSLEYFRIPRGVLVICQGKSTYARCGIVVNVTPFEPEWEGFVTVSLVNAAPIPVRVYAGEGIAQAVFIKGENECTTSYADRKGKYQGQRKIQIARL
jgi:dCTP deaminase